MKSYDENLKILKSITPKWTLNERIPLTNALNRILASDIIAQDPHPAYPTSAMDGYAIKFNNQDQKIKVINITPAGHDSDININDGQCIKTLTGALVCNQADTIVPIENVKFDGEYIEII